MNVYFYILYYIYDHTQEVASVCGISAMPTFQVWKDGKKVDELVGASKDKLEELLVRNA